jgi:hypothetical protein
MSMGVQAPEIVREQGHQDREGTSVIAGVFSFGSLDDRIRIEVLGVGAGNYLFHLEAPPFAVRDDGLRPIVEGFVFLAPVLFCGVPLSHIAKRERRQAEG